MINDYKDLLVWQKAMDLSVDCYRLSAGFPSSERYGITVQLRDAAVSVPANIAEGRGRRGTREFLRYLNIAYGSLNELQTHLILAERLGFTPAGGTAPLIAQTEEVAKMLNGLKNALRSRTQPKSLNPKS